MYELLPSRTWEILLKTITDNTLRKSIFAKTHIDSWLGLGNHRNRPKAAGFAMHINEHLRRKVHDIDT